MFRVCLVEDEQSLIELISLNLEMEGYAVHCFTDGQKALEVLSEPFHYDLIILDVMMPEMDGITAAQRIRSMTYESFCNVPLVAFTAGVTDEERQKAKDAGMHYFMPKPFTKDDLINLIAELGLISL